MPFPVPFLGSFLVPCPVPFLGRGPTAVHPGGTRRRAGWWAPRPGWHPEPVSELDDLVGPRLTLPEVADALGIEVTGVRRLIRDRDLVALRLGDPPRQRVPAALLPDGQPLQDLRGTLVVLSDAGFSDEEAVRWLFTADPSLPGRPIDALREGRKTEIRRRAQALAV